MPLSITQSQFRPKVFDAIERLGLTSEERKTLRVYAANAPLDALESIHELLTEKDGPQKLLQLVALKRDFLKTGSEYALEQAKNKEKEIIGE